MSAFYYTQIKKIEDFQSLFSDDSIFNLYKACFNELPYEEVCDEEETRTLFLNYFKRGILLLSFEQETNELVGFAAAIPLKYEVEISKLAKSFDCDILKDWYHADLGTAKKFRRKGIAEMLVKNLIQLIPSNRIIMRTQESNIASKACHMKLGFQIIEGMYQNVKKVRTSGDVKVDKRIFLSYSKLESDDKKRDGIV